MRVVFVLAVALAVPLCASVEEIKSLLEGGRFQDALAASDRDLKANGNDPRVWTLHGMALSALGQPAQARKDFEHALKLAPKFLPALQNLAQIEYQSGDPGCERLLEQIVTLRPDDQIAHGMLGALAMERSDCERGLAEYKSAGQTIAGNNVARWQSGTCYFQDGNWNGAAEEFRAVLARHDSEAVRFNLALAELQAGKPAAAVDTLLPLAGKPETDSDTLSLLASAYEADKRTPEALAALQAALKKNPHDERLYTELAAQCLDHNAVRLGIDVLKTGAEILPESARLQTMLGVLEARAGETEAARQHFDQAGKLAPDGPLASVALSVMLMQSGSVDEAVRVLEDELARVPGSIPTKLTLAEALLQRNHNEQDVTRAEALLKEVIRQNPSEPRAYSVLGKIYADRGDNADARPTLEKALSLDPNDSTATYQLMLVYKRGGHLPEANRLAERVRELLEKQRVEERQSSRYTLVRSPVQ